MNVFKNVMEQGEQIYLLVYINDYPFGIITFSKWYCYRNLEPAILSEYRKKDAASALVFSKVYVQLLKLIKYMSFVIDLIRIT